MLSGEVKIREQVVVSWTAECIEPTKDWPGRWNYEVVAEGVYAGRKFRRMFMSPHDRNAGPLVLTSNIMTDLMLMLSGMETE